MKAPPKKVKVSFIILHTGQLGCQIIYPLSSAMMICRMYHHHHHLSQRRMDIVTCLQQSDRSNLNRHRQSQKVKPKSFPNAKKGDGGAAAGPGFVFKELNSLYSSNSNTNYNCTSAASPWLRNEIAAHFGVSCSYCGIKPITGPVFKSKL